jgi:hypothetical protein
VASGDFLDLSERAARQARYDTTDTNDMLRAKEAVNQAYLTACSRDGVKFSFLEQEGQWTTESGEDTYTYTDIGTGIGINAASIAEIMWLVNDSDGSVLDSMSWEDLERKTFSSQDGEPSGEPFMWAKWGSRIRLFPTPDAEYNVGALVRLVPDEMVGDTDEPIIPLEFRFSVILPHATATLLRMEGGQEAHQEAQFHQRQYEDGWIAMRTAKAAAIPGKPDFRLKGSDWDRPFGRESGDVWRGGW